MSVGVCVLCVRVFVCTLYIYFASRARKIYINNIHRVCVQNKSYTQPNNRANVTQYIKKENKHGTQSAQTHTQGRTRTHAIIPEMKFIYKSSIQSIQYFVVLYSLGIIIVFGLMI